MSTQTLQPTAPAPRTFGAPVLEASGVVMRFGGLTAVNDVNLTVGEGEIMGLIGPNGAGKTTFFNCLTGMYKPTEGEVKFLGTVLPPKPRSVVKAGMARTFQNIRLFGNMTALENVMVGRYCRTNAMALTSIIRGPKYRREEAESRRIAQEWLDFVGLGHTSEHLARNLPYGDQRRLEIARALLHAPRILFLDEPTVGLDAQTRQRMWSYLDELRRKRELTVVVTTHYIEEVEECDTVCIIDHGKVLASGTPDKLKQQFGSELVKVVPRDPQAAADLLAAYPDAAERDPNILVIPVVGTDFSDRLMAQFGQRIRQLSFVTPSLESVFISLTGQELRDKASNDRERTLAFAKSGGEHTR